MASRPARLMAAAAREMCGAAVLTAVACALASCSASSPSRGRASSPGPAPSGAFTPAPLETGSRPAWVLTKAALAQVVTDPGILAGLEQSRVLEILHPGQKPLALAGAQPLVTFSSVGELEQAVSAASCPPGRGCSCTTRRPGRSRPGRSSSTRPPPRAGPGGCARARPVAHRGPRAQPHHGPPRPGRRPAVAAVPPAGAGRRDRESIGRPRTAGAEPGAGHQHLRRVRARRGRAGPRGQSAGEHPGRAVHQPARGRGHQPAAQRRDPGHPRGR